MKNVIVTGANGFVGHYLVKLLSEKRYNIYSIIRNEKEDISNIVDISNVKIIYCDMSEIERLEELLEGIYFEYCYHLAWAGSSGDLRKNYELQMNNVLWTAKLLEVLSKLKVRRCLMAGSVTQLMYREYFQNDNITPEMETIYAIAKINAEYLSKCLCAKYGMDLCWTYITNFYGADDTTKNFINFLIENYMNDKVPVLTEAEQMSDFTYVTDIARGLICACEKGKANTSYYIGYGKPRKLKYYINMVKDIVNPSLESGIGMKKFNGKSVDFDKIDYMKLNRDTGFLPLIDFEEGIKECVDAKRNDIKK